jgi:hypothetical protein
MKKTYIAPQTTMFVVEPQHVIAASPTGAFDAKLPGDQNVIINDEEFNGEFSSRRYFDVWGDFEF